jgi:hypothetical protein
MHKLEKLMEKKKGKKLSENEIAAKSSVLKDLSDTASDMMKDKLSGLKKVTVAAPDKDKLKEGLKLAEKITDKMPNGEDSGMEDAKEHEEEMVAEAEHDGQEEESDESEEAGEEKTKEELLAELERLKAKIEKMS